MFMLTAIEEQVAALLWPRKLKGSSAAPTIQTKFLIFLIRVSPCCKLSAAGTGAGAPLSLQPG